MHTDEPRKRTIELGIAGIDKQAGPREGQQLRLAGQHDDVVAADATDEVGIELLIAASEEVALAADNADHDLCRPLCCQYP